MSNFVDIDTLVQIAKLYYENNFTQQAIAKRLKISRPYVSKLLMKARELGVVEIKISNTMETESNLEILIREKFKLKRAIVVPIGDDNFTSNLEMVSTATARFLYNVVKDNDIVGVAWGYTMNACAEKLVKKDLDNVKVVQLYGGLNSIESGAYYGDTTLKFANALNANPYFMLVPAIVENDKIKSTFIKDKTVSFVLDLAMESQIALFSVGEFGQESSLVKSNYLTSEEVENLLEKGAVGDACGRLFTTDGNIVDSEFDRRTIGIPLDNLCEKKYSILVAADKRKAKGIHGILQGRYANVLIIDEVTAKALLALQL